MSQELPTRVYSAPLASRHADRIQTVGGDLVDLDEPPGDAPAVLFRTVGRAPREDFIKSLRTHPDIVWVHTVAAGADDLLGAVPAHVQLTRTPGPAGPPVAEYAVAALLMLVRDFPRLMAAQRNHEWLPAFRSRRFNDLTVIILGWGAIGHRAAEFCEAFDMEVQVVRRSPDPGAFPRQYPPDRLVDLAQDGDALIVACALTPETRGIVDGPILRALGPEGLLVNVARGPVVQRDALISALTSRELGGAVLDVTEPEPLPPDDPLWDVPGLVITPHLSGFAGRTAASEVIGLFCENLTRFRDDRPLLHVVDPELGY